MEPAGYRREHANGTRATGWPQWSPPGIGGSRWVPVGGGTIDGVPQWSPPVIGGSRARKI